MRNCRKIEGLEVSKCETVAKLRGWMLDYAQHTPHSYPQMRGLLVCLPVLWLTGPNF